MSRTAFLAVCLLTALGAASTPLLGKYKIQEIQLRPAQEYLAHQKFQHIAIGAYPCNTKARTLELFDTSKLFEKKIMPVLLVIENNNDFALRMHEEDIFFVDTEGSRLPAIHYSEVLLRINLKKPLSSYSTQREILLREVRNKEMLMDFEHKAFGEKLIAPHSADHGVVFFWLPEQGDLTGSRLYFPSVLNFTEDEELMFFEFELGTSKNE